MDLPILIDISIIFALAIPIIFICDKMHISSLVALLITGIIAGPESLGFIHSHEHVEELAEIGVILLLFTIGIEFSLKDLWKMRNIVLIGGTLQLILTALGTAFLLWVMQYPLKTSIFFGCLLFPSSTAIVLKLLQENAKIATPHGQFSLAILIYQDIAVVPLMLLFPILAGNMENLGASLSFLALKAVGVIIFTLVSALWIVPKFLKHVVKTRNQELFLLCIVTIAVVTALTTMKIGLSLGLGAFLAGLIISESPYSYQALAGVLPFRQIFLPFFFISVGMLLNTHFFINNLGLIFILTCSVFIWKFLVVFSISLLFRVSIYESIIAGITIAQVGEFAFVLASAGLQNGISLENIYQPFLAVSVVTMGITPFLMSYSSRIADTIIKIPFLAKWSKQNRDITESDHTDKKDHIIIIGYGTNGRNIAHAARVGNIPYIIIELNPLTVQQEAVKGEPIYYGDAIHSSILEHAGIHQARIVVVVISSSLAARKIVNISRSLNPNIHIIARTRFVKEVKHLIACGANIAIPEEFETSVEIFTHVMKKYLIPENNIKEFTKQIRSNNYQILRQPNKIKMEWEDLKLNIPEVEISVFHISQKNANLIDEDLQNLHLRKNYGVTILAIRRQGEMIFEIHGDTKLIKDDQIVVIGMAQKLNDFALFLEK